MEKTDKVEFTPEGFQKVVDALTFLPEEQRLAMLKLVCSQMLS